MMHPVRIGDNSLNFAQVHLILALAASSTPPPDKRINNKIKNFCKFFCKNTQNK